MTVTISGAVVVGGVRYPLTTEVVLPDSDSAPAEEVKLCLSTGNGW